MGKALILAGIGIVLGVSLGAFNQAGRGQDAKNANKGWEDYKDLKETERLRERPGNYQILGAISEFLDNSYKLQPDLNPCIYPLQLDSKTLANREEAEKWLDRLKPRNKFRSYNLNIKSLFVHDAGEMERSEELRKKLGKQYVQDLFLAVRKRHPGRAVVVLLDLELHSLQSKKIEAGDPIILYLVHSKNRWRVAWFDK
jgi:hypothetical protein